MRVSAKPPPIAEVPMSEIDEILQRARKGPLSEKDCQLLRRVAESYVSVTQLVENKGTSINRLRQMLFGAATEKTKNVLGEEELASSAGKDKSRQKERQKKKPKGHGRNGAVAYRGAEKVKVPHQTLTPGETCPKCDHGKLNSLKAPGLIIRVRGQAPLGATVYELEKLRCNLCCEVFTAAAPEGIGEEKYDEKAASMIALLKYGNGLPFYRLAGLQGSLGIPLPPSTQWDIVNQLAVLIGPAFSELIRQAAQGKVLHNDDTTMKILELMEKRKKQEAVSGKDPERTGIFTSGIVSTKDGRRIALFFTGQQHAGENLASVLERRAKELSPPIQMCDPLSRNTSPEFAAIVASCTAHARRKFVEIAGSFPAECHHVLDILGKVYKNDAATKKQEMSAEERLQFHQAESRPLMTPLRRWLRQQLRERRVEPNSGLGEAIIYMLRHWEKLTLFLRVAGAPLDNNICEAALKRAILHRKNSMFYKTEKGARVGDLFMSLIHSCVFSKANAFDYLTQLQKHADKVSGDPQAWMPWNYRMTLGRVHA